MSIAIRALGAGLLGLHGLVHLIGVALLWQLAEPGDLTYADAVPAAGSTAGVLAGAGWLLAAILFVAAAVLLLLDRRWWAHVTVLAALVSLVVVVPVASVAPFALVMDFLAGLVGLAVVVASRRGELVR